ncbi:hypothetical protein D3C80_947850 [compost metagenome]
MVVNQHATGFDAAAVEHGFRRKGDLTGFRHDAEIVFRLDSPKRAQAEAVETRADDIAIAEDQRCRPVVLLFIKREILEHRDDFSRQCLVVFPCRRHHRDNGGHQIEAVFQNAGLQRLVETAAVRLSLGTDDRGVLGCGNRCLGQAVLAVGVEFAVMRHLPERLGHRRMRVRVGGKPRVEIHGVDRVIRIHQIAEVRNHLIRVEAALQYLRAGAERNRVKTAKFGARIGLRLDGKQRLVDAEVEFGLRSGLAVTAEDPLADRQLVTNGGRPDRIIVDRHVALQQNSEPLFRQRRLDETLGFLMECRICRQEEVADAEAARLKIWASGQLAEKAQR